MTKPATPVRKTLRSTSSLLAAVCDGLGAVAGAHKVYIAADLRNTFADSLDLDAALASAHPTQNRWDYLLGHGPSAAVVAVEPHSAKQGEIDTVIRKRAMARQQLQAHLRPGAEIAKWLWVASGEVHFADTERARRRLDQNGIEFVGKRIKSRHLPVAASVTSSK